jgi:phosphoglycerate dehydrogenase-like enzyme
MELSRPPLVVAFELSEKRKAIVADALAGASAVVCLTELDEAARAEALRNTGALLTFNTSKELRSGEAELSDGARLIQFIIAGVDFIPLGELPEGVPVATNGGGYAESMAEHALAMALAAAKRLILEHENLKLGQFNQFTRNRKKALEDRISALGRSGSWPQIIADLDSLTETEIEHDGKRFVVRSAPRPAASLAIRAAGVALPPTVRQVAD